MDYQKNSVEQFAKHLSNLFPAKEIEALLGNELYESYQDDPVEFCQDLFQEEYTEEVQTLMNSVRDYPVTIARSANAVGKSHAAARIALWAYKSFPEVQVYLAAAPPEDNLRRILWGELEDTISKCA